MSIKINIRTLLMALIVMVLLFATANTYVEARINKAEKAMALNTIVVDGGPGFVMVSPMQFRPFRPIDTWAYSANYNLISDSPNQRMFVAGLTLPHGATITRAIAYYRDWVPANMGYALYRCPLNDSCETMGWGSTSENMDLYTYKFFDPFTPFEVDNQSYTYMLFVVFNTGSGSDIQLSGVRIDYEYTVYTPMITK